MMSRLLFVFGFIAGLTISPVNAGNPFVPAEDVLETHWMQAQEVPLTALALSSSEAISSLVGGTADLQGNAFWRATEGDVLIAFLLATFLGGIGVHRLYLKAPAVVFVVYLLTGGFCGILSFIDWILLLVELINRGSGVTSQYYGCSSLFMFSCD